MDAIVFDLGGVVFDYQPDIRRSQFSEATGLPTQEIQKRLFDSGYSQSCDSGRLSGARLYEEGVRLLGMRLSLDRFRRIWISAFTPNSGVIDQVKRLKDRYPVALLTNNSDLVREGLITAFPDTMALFRPQFFSCDIGVQKPHPKIFQTVLQMLDVEGTQALFVDDAAKHIAGAQSLGLATIHYKNAEQLGRELEDMGLVSA